MGPANKNCNKKGGKSGWNNVNTIPYRISIKKRRGRFSLTDDSSREGVLSGSNRPCLVFVVHTDLCKNSRSWVKDKNKTTRSKKKKKKTPQKKKKKKKKKKS